MLALFASKSCFEAFSLVNYSHNQTLFDAQLSLIFAAFTVQQFVKSIPLLHQSVSLLSSLSDTLLVCYLYDVVTLQRNLPVGSDTLIVFCYSCNILTIESQYIVFLVG